jgi:lipopolysaccharide/colanic/teichoic acid biosynthesis glycosyltransferase
MNAFAKIPSFVFWISLGLALIAFVVLFPVMLLIAPAIWMDSPGLVVFRQVRIGMHGLSFTLCEFRTMYHQADQGKDPLPVPPNDLRVTRIGRWVRRFRFDEWPQLYNILAVHMPLVGPRPFVPNQGLELAEKIPLSKQRWAIRPGATGWAQVHISIGFDLLILFKTSEVVFAGVGGR